MRRGTNGAIHILEASGLEIFRKCRKEVKKMPCQFQRTHYLSTKHLGHHISYLNVIYQKSQTSTSAKKVPVDYSLNHGMTPAINLIFSTKLLSQPLLITTIKQVGNRKLQEMKDFVVVFYFRNFRFFPLYVAENSIIKTKKIFIPRIHSEN